MAFPLVSPSPHTLATYNRSIAQIRKAVAPLTPLNDYSFLSNHEAIISWIVGTDYSTNSKKTFYISLVSKLKGLCLVGDDGMSEAAGAYRAKMDALNSSIRENAESQELSETEKAKYLPWPQVMECLEKVRLAVFDAWTFQQYLIVALYCLTPPVRLDYAGMKIISNKEMIQAGRPPQDTSCNYLVLGDKPYFIFNKYKTEKRYGAQMVMIPPALYEIIDEWRDMVDDEYLLINQNGQPMPEWQLGQTITEVFKKHSGKAVGVNVLRHSFISFNREGEPSFKTTQALAQSMMHSPEMNQLYRKL
jgi:hypothetical protein